MATITFKGKKISNEEALSLLKEDGLNLQYMPIQSEEMGITAIYQNPESFLFLQKFSYNIGKEIFLNPVKLALKVTKYLKNVDDQFCQKFCQISISKDFYKKDLKELETLWEKHVLKRKIMNI